jgi:uncharacterized membrane protein
MNHREQTWALIATVAVVAAVATLAYALLGVKGQSIGAYPILAILFVPVMIVLIQAFLLFFHRGERGRDVQ